jgi:exopolysaccharide biosynthesis polyprenyl glycosylphosphotransferase
MLALSNRYLPRRLAKFSFKTASRQRTLLIGMPSQAAMLQGWLERKKEYGIDVVGLLCDEVQTGNFVGHFQVVGSTQELEAAILEHKVRQIIMLDAIPTTPMLLYYISICDRLGARFTVISSFGEGMARKIRVSEDEGFQFFSFRNEPLESPSNRIIKRTMDICVSLPVVVFILPPLSLIVWLIQQRQSPGSLFYYQARTGANGREFQIMKYRTMCEGGFDESIQAGQNDERVYPLGKFLRKTSLDELPQFMNVLRAEMSVVGPRPHMPTHDEQFERAAFGYRMRNFVKPGITGLAQISGYRGATHTDDDVIKRVEKDLDYTENWSPVLDVVIIAKTAVHVIFPPSNSY